MLTNTDKKWKTDAALFQRYMDTSGERNHYAIVPLDEGKKRRWGGGNDVVGMMTRRRKARKLENEIKRKDDCYRRFRVCKQLFRYRISTYNNVNLILIIILSGDTILRMRTRLLGLCRYAQRPGRSESLHLINEFQGPVLHYD
jgi:hypothetical protein